MLKHTWAQTRLEIRGEAMRCEQCKYCHTNELMESSCRKKAPGTFQISDGGESYALHCWPKVRWNDYCGDFEQADETPEKPRLKQVLQSGGGL